MRDETYLHRIDYFLRRRDGSLERTDTEIADDHGWYIQRGDAWKRHYTCACATDFLARTGAEAGLYSVAVWRGDQRVCTVALHWDG